MTLSATYTQTGSAAAYRSPYGTWAGYTSMIVKDFNRANEGAALIGMKLDLAVVKMPGFALTTNVVFGNGAMEALRGAPLSTNNEYDFTLDYLVANSVLDWPDWLRPLWLRGRVALLDQYQGGCPDDDPGLPCHPELRVEVRRQRQHQEVVRGTLDRMQDE